MAFNLSKELKDVPCSFNLSIGREIPWQRLKYAEQKIKADLASEYLTSAEKIRNLNLLSWVMFKLENITEAAELNEKALQGSIKNLTAMGNELFIAYERGDRKSVGKLLRELNHVTRQDNFQRLKVVAQAEQAYSYISLNLLDCYDLCKGLLLHCTEEFPGNYLWKLDLGFLYARLFLHRDAKPPSNEMVNSKDLLSTCVTLLMEVADEGDEKLKGSAYAELSCLRHKNYKPEMDSIFNGFSVQELTFMALNFGSDNHAILSQCGKNLKHSDIDRAIDLLRKSIQLRPTSKAHAHLGDCLVKKADLIACGKYRTQRSPQHQLKQEIHRKKFGNRNKRGNSTGFWCEKKLDNKPQGRHTKQDCIPLDSDDALVKEAFHCYSESLKFSYEENLTARLNLARLHFKVGGYEAALVELNQIVDKNDVTVTYYENFISAHDLAGKCLLKLNTLTENCNNIGKHVEEAQKYIINTVSLAAGLASKIPEHKHCASELWNSFKKLLKEMEDIPSSVCKSKQLNDLLNLAVVHDIFHEVELIVSRGFFLRDAEISQRVLKNLLRNEKYEDALTYLKAVSCETSFKPWLDPLHKLLGIQSRMHNEPTYTGSLKESSEVVKLLFQQMFHMKYGHCRGGAIEAEDNMKRGDTRRNDVLIVHYGSELRETGQVAHNLSLVLESVFGLEVCVVEQKDFMNCKSQGDLPMKQMMDYCVVLFILGENDTQEYAQMFKTAINSDVTHVVVMNLTQSKSRPRFLKRGAFLNFTNRFWMKTKLALTTAGDSENGLDDEVSRSELLDSVVTGNKEAVLRLFCCLVDEKFENHRKPSQPKLLKRKIVVENMTSNNPKKMKKS